MQSSTAVGGRVTKTRHPRSFVYRAIAFRHFIHSYVSIDKSSPKRSDRVLHRGPTDLGFAMQLQRRDGSGIQNEDEPITPRQNVRDEGPLNPDRRGTFRVSNSDEWKLSKIEYKHESI